MQALRPFRPKKRTASSVFRGFAHWLSQLFSQRKVVKFSLTNVPLSYWVPGNSYFSRHLAKYGSHEAENSNWVLAELPTRQASGGIFVDVGANFGWYSMLFSICAGPNGRVIAIEPEPGNLQLLRRNIAENASKNVTVVAAGVGASAGSAELSLIDAANPGKHSMRTGESSYAQVAIEIKTLDAILENTFGEIELLKMDIEGFEVDALLGAGATLARTKRVMIEFSPKFIRACGRDPHQFLAIFDENNFKPFLMQDGALVPSNIDQLIAMDVAAGLEKFWQVDIFYTK
jgi:FkbM family methyltransferase